ncbi:aminoacetone oxidase family FAD-binding enzyme [Pararhodobacter sp. SW119]|uniref:NAD(P)/FAD-dependent oxidoreductase n=1 Tax=Pararhodobacter sp. SW119 TaxID=2780075 RepID=UPI0032AFE556
MWDAIVLGAGAAGLMCAIEAARRGRRVLVLDHASAAGEKIRISGGGRCNFTNLQITPDRFLSQNPRFAHSALGRYTEQDFIDRVTRAGIGWHEKTLGQFFCDGSARQIVDMRLRDLHAAGGELRLGVRPRAVRRGADGVFRIENDAGEIAARAVVLATGGKSIPKMGASDFGYRVAEAFGLRIVPTRPALVPLVFTDAQLEAIRPLAGLSVQARVGAKGADVAFQEGLLFTHRGLSGPSILQISSYWTPDRAIRVDLSPGRDLAAEAEAGRATGLGGRDLVNVLDLPQALARSVVASGISASATNQPRDQITAHVAGPLPAVGIKRNHCSPIPARRNWSRRIGNHMSHNCPADRRPEEPPGCCARVQVGLSRLHAAAQKAKGSASQPPTRGNPSRIRSPQQRAT